MNAINRKRHSKTERDFIKHEVNKIYRENQQKHEEKMLDRFMFWFMISLCKTMDDEFGFGQQRLNHLKKSLLDTMNEISQYLTSNTCETKDGKEFDIDYNRTVLQRLAEQYGVKFDESIFDDDEVKL